MSRKVLIAVLILSSQCLAQTLTPFPAVQRGSLRRRMEARCGLALPSEMTLTCGQMAQPRTTCDD
jgi:hypothetical protein